MISIRSGIAVALSGIVLAMASAALGETYRHTITGEELKVLDESPKEGRDTEAVKRFLKTGINPYIEVKACFPKGEELYLTGCSGCHGHVAEGKLGPGLNDAYWTYPKNNTDKGLFETIFGGAQGMMGPHGSHIQLDEMLQMMAWIRHLYTGDVAEASWLTDAQKKEFQPYKAGEHAAAGGDKKVAAATECKPSAN